MNNENEKMQGAYNEGEQSNNLDNINIKEKKKKSISFFKMAIIALVLGIGAGAALQGYFSIKNPVSQSQSNDRTDSSGLITTNSDSDMDNNADQIMAGEGIVTDVSAIVDEVIPSIVAINSTASITSYDFFGRSYKQQSQASGSGIIIGLNKNELLIVTNNHVVEDSSNIEIVFVDDTTAKAKIKGADSNSDLAILSVDMDDISKDTASAIKVATLGDSNEVNQGDLVIAIGNALGYGQSVTVGYISAANREITMGNTKTTLIQTDAAINPGNSGGALLDSSGMVIGINSIKYASTEVEGMGYAIPISKAIPMINELMNREVVSSKEQGYLGIDISKAQNVTEIYSQRFNMPIGVYVYSVVEGSPAEKAGLKQGNIITGLDNIEIKTIDDLVNALSYKKAGQTIKLKIQEMENGKYVEKILEVTLGKKK